MVNTVNCYMSILRTTMKLAGMQPTEIEIEPGTVIHFWVNDTTRLEKANKKEKKQPTAPQPPPQRPPVVLIQGFLGDGLLTWQFQILPLIKKYSLYIPDLLYFGGSHTDKTERSTRFQADCIAKGLKKLGVVDHEKCVVVGFSYGGFVGFQMAQYYPELVGSMVVCGSALALSETITRKSLERIGFSSWPEFLLPVSVEGVKVLLETSSYTLPWLPGFFYKHFLEAMFGNRKEKVELLEALVVKDDDVPSHQFQQRIYLLWGADEKIFNLEDAINLKERLLEDKTKLQVVEKAGHLCLLERPCAFNKCLKEMLETLSNRE